VERFADLFDALDRTTSTNDKVAALSAYFRSAPAADAAWALYFLTGRRIKRLLVARALVEWALRESGLPGWLFEESFSAVGDLAETISLLLDTRSGGTPERLPLSEWIERRLLPLRGLDPAMQGRMIATFWNGLDRRGRFLFNKLVTGEFRVGVSHTLVVRALAQAAGLDAPTIEHRLMGSWEPSAGFFEQLMAPESAGDRSRPYPFYLASPLTEPPESLGPIEDWLCEWKWDGIRAQIVRRGGQTFLWSRGDELLTDRFPEVRTAADALPDGLVVDGEILAFRDTAPLAFSVLQRRIGRQKLSEDILAAAPVAFVAFDLLEQAGADVRTLPLRERRSRLEQLLSGCGPHLRVSPTVAASDWAELAQKRTQARDRGVEGLMLKRLESPYKTGRRRGDWWKWKIDPFTIDAVLVYAQPGHGRRAALLTDYTFAVWRGNELVPIAKAYSGLSNDEIAELDKWIRQHTVERFGPVRSVEPVRVFELHFEAIARSTRHKSGLAVRFPRIARWRSDKSPRDADTIERVLALLDAQR